MKLNVFQFDNYIIVCIWYIIRIILLYSAQRKSHQHVQENIEVSCMVYIYKAMSMNNNYIYVENEKTVNNACAGA